MKKILSLVLVIIMAMTLFSCGGNPDVTTAEPNSSENPDVSSSSEITTGQPAPELSDLTREELEEAFAATAYDYFVKTTKIQYDSTYLEKNFLPFFSGRTRLDYFGRPEDATADRTIYSVCSDFAFKVYYEGLGFKVFNATSYLDMPTTIIFQICQTQKYGASEDFPIDNMLLARYMKDGFKFTSEDVLLGLHKDEKIDMDRDRFYAFMSDFKTNLRTGDLIVAGYKGTGHAMLYLGNNLMIECTGSKMNLTSGQDSVETAGAIAITTFEETFLNGTRATYYIKNESTNQRDWIIVMRPLNCICVDDGDGNPGNDKARAAYPGIPASTYTRIANPGIDIERTSSLHTYGTAVKGENVTYSVCVTNSSYHSRFRARLKQIGSSFTGIPYTGLTITETIPEGSELVEGSITGGGVYKDGKITWTIDSIDVSKSATVKYTVKVTGEAGTLLVNDGGFVGDIPSNVLTNKIGYGKTPATDEAFLQAFPAEKDIISALFDSGNVTEKRISAIPNYSSTLTAYAVTLKDRASVADEYKPYYDMLIYGYIGGKGFHGDPEGDYYKVARDNDLLPGDIIIYTELDDFMKPLSSSPESYLYVGNNVFLHRKSNGTITQETGRTFITKNLAKGLFFALRPGQA